jgi:hypothetical protein
MLGYRKKSFARAHAILEALRTNPKDVGVLLTLQQLLCREILRTEQRIRELKCELRGVGEAGGASAPKRSSILKSRIEKVRQCAYVWRCFGDGIAFIYMDKFALKQCFYSIENTTAKQDAGFISDKRGLADEISLLEIALQNEVPALLTDLTNTIRYGDVCLMDTPDPRLIEVKASKKLDSRGRKQRRNLEKLQSFFETDKIAELRGFSNVRRQASERPERTHIEELNACITDALKNGCASRSPERGLFYVVASRERSAIQEVLQSLELKAPLAFDLNEAKNHRAWASYYPFILSIEDKDHLWDFIRGQLYIVVFVEPDTLCQIASDEGYETKFDWDNQNYPLRITIPGMDRPSGVSSQFLARIGMEFVSPEWAVLASIDILKRGLEAVKEESADQQA